MKATMIVVVLFALPLHAVQPQVRWFNRVGGEEVVGDGVQGGFELRRKEQARRDLQQWQRKVGREIQAEEIRLEREYQQHIAWMIRYQRAQWKANARMARIQHRRSQPRANMMAVWQNRAQAIAWNHLARSR